MTVDLMRLKAERIAKGYTQAQLAEKVGMTRNSYAKREAGFVSIGADELATIATMLGYASDDFKIFFKVNVPEKERKSK
jgi:transcriptional regulator with XRE-family HTH domain